MNDPLTGLPDRWQFLDTLQIEVSKASENHSKLALLVVEIKKFHRINMLYRYSVGDQVLKAFADVLHQVARKQDIICKIGDCKFTLLLTDIASEEHAKLAAYKIHRLLENIFELEFESIRCMATVGIALYPINAVEPEDLFQDAEIALDQAKLSGHSIGLADNTRDNLVYNELDLEVDLLSAVEGSQLKIFFQPKISAATGLPTGAEALIRWQHPEQGLLAPYQFLPIVESAGLDKPVTSWVLNSALRLTNQWTEKWGDLTVSVNIPTIFIEQADFVDIVQSAQELWQKKNITLCLEILENSLIDKISSSFSALKNMQSKGVKISIDDFGTGYSSLSYFRDIPANELKIDKSFVMNFNNDQANKNIVELIIDLAHGFDLTVVAEGVEDAETAAALQKIQCDELQGYYYAKPMSAEKFKLWLIDYEPII